MSDPFEGFTRGLESPASKHFDIVADAGNDLDPRPRVLRCQADGNITIRDDEGVDKTYGCVAGEVLTFSPVRVTALTGAFVGWL